MEKLQRLGAACGGRIVLFGNAHLLNGTQSQEDYFDDQPEEDRPSASVLEEMRASGLCWMIQFHSKEPFTFHRLYDSNVDRLLDRALACMSL